MKTTTKPKPWLLALLTFSGIFTVILGFGYWHSLTHGAAYINVKFKAAAEQRPQPLPGAKVLFLDGHGQVLATGISDEQYSYIHLLHPEVGDCHEKQNQITNQQSRTAWQQCFSRLSTWIVSWIKELRQIKVNHPVCSTDAIPVTVNEYNSEWPLWWVPLPHVGGKPYSYFSTRITIEPDACINQEQ